MNKLKFAFQTFVGRRDNNQDSCIAIEINEDVLFLAVADGMGGVAGGKIASNIVIQNSLELLTEEFNDVVEEPNLKFILEKIFLSGQVKIRERITTEPVLSGMGTTLTAILVYKDKYVWGNLGDSRIYRLYNNTLDQITVDHTYIEDYKKEHPGDVPDYVIEQYSHYLTKSMDGGSDTPDMFPEDKDHSEILHNEMFLLCSDGLITNKVELDTSPLKKYIVGISSLQKSARNLISDAFHNGSKDNISVVLAESRSYPREQVSLKKYFYPPSDNKLLKLLESKFLIVSGVILFLIILIVIISFI